VESCLDKIMANGLGIAEGGAIEAKKLNQEPL